MNARTLFPISLAVAASAFTPALARADADHGVRFGVRAAYEGIYGKADSNITIHDYIKGGFALQADAGYRFDPHWYLGGSLTYTIGFVNNDNGQNSGSSAHGLRIVAQGEYRLTPDQNWTPWIGAGFGYESATFTTDFLGISFDTTYSGFELFHGELGVDFKAGGEAFGVGPYIGFSASRYDSCSSSGGCSVQSAQIHELLFLGARGTFSL